MISESVSMPSPASRAAANGGAGGPAASDRAERVVAAGNLESFDPVALADLTLALSNGSVHYAQLPPAAKEALGNANAATLSQAMQDLPFDMQNVLAELLNAAHRMKQAEQMDRITESRAQIQAQLLAADEGQRSADDNKKAGMFQGVSSVSAGVLGAAGGAAQVKAGAGAASATAAQMKNSRIANGIESNKSPELAHREMDVQGRADVAAGEPGKVQSQQELESARARDLQRRNEAATKASEAGQIAALKSDQARSYSGLSQGVEGLMNGVSKTVTTEIEHDSAEHGVEEKRLNAVAEGHQSLAALSGELKGAHEALIQKVLDLQSALLQSNSQTNHQIATA